jgi:hypothetical protein
MAVVNVCWGTEAAEREVTGDGPYSTVVRDAAGEARWTRQLFWRRPLRE